MTPNEKIANDFAGQFDPPLKAVRTLAVNGVKYPDAWQVTYWSQMRSIGVTAVFYEGQVHAYLECAGRADIAIQSGRAFAIALGMAPLEKAKP